MMHGAQSGEAIAAWSKNQGRKWLGLLGMRRRRGPSHATIKRIFKGIDRVQLEEVLGQWSQSVLIAADPTANPVDGSRGITSDEIEGKKRENDRSRDSLQALNQWVETMMSNLSETNQQAESRGRESLFEGLVLSGYGDSRNQHISESGLKIWAVDYEGLGDSKGATTKRSWEIGEDESESTREGEFAIPQVQGLTGNHIQNNETRTTAG
jgi:hypothetical protein